MNTKLPMTRPSPFVLWLTGASGVGKTTAFRVLEARLSDTPWVFLHLDGFGQMHLEEAIEPDGSLSNDQHRATRWQIRKIVQDYSTAEVVVEVVVVDGQTNLDFVEESCKEFGVEHYSIVLLDCDWEIIRERLINQRKQPHLANPQMENWVKFLHNQVPA